MHQLTTFQSSQGQHKCIFNVSKLSPQVPRHLELRIKKSTMVNTLAKVNSAIFNQIGWFKFLWWLPLDIYRLSLIFISTSNSKTSRWMLGALMSS